MLRSLPPSLLGSFALHAALVAAFAAAAHFRPPPAESTGPRERPVEIELYERPPSPRPAARVEPAPVAPTDARPASSAARRTVAAAVPARPSARESTSAPAASAVETVPTVLTTSEASLEPPIAQPPVAAPAPRLSAADLYGNIDGLASAAAAQSGLDLGTPQRGPSGSRNLFGRERHGTAEERAREAASAPTIAALAGSQHMQAAGTMTHDRTVARRAEEEFDPVRSVAALGAAVLRAPVITIAPPPRRVSAGESAAAEAFDRAQGSSFAGMTVGGQMPTLSFHLVRADVEVDQDRSGAVLATRVVRRSGVAGFDDAAVRAIRNGLPQARAIQSSTGRRSRWSFEVSDSQSGGIMGTAGLGGDQGWRVIAEPSGGVRLRMRVRMIGASALNGS